MKKFADIGLVVIGIVIIAWVVIAHLYAGNCGNAKVVRDVEYIYYDQDSIDSAYYHHKADSFIRAVKERSQHE